MQVPTNESDARQCAWAMVPDGADDSLIVGAARELLAILMTTWIDRLDFRWSVNWVREDIIDVSLVYLELECSDEGMEFQRRHPAWLVWEAIGVLQHKALWPDDLE